MPLGVRGDRLACRRPIAALFEADLDGEAFHDSPSDRVRSSLHKA